MVSRKLPSELEEEILIQVPRQSLARLRTVCKEWNTLFNDKIFVNKHLACSHPEFVLQTDSNICSISINLNDDPIQPYKCFVQPLIFLVITMVTAMGTSSFMIVIKEALFGTRG
ncbi:putative F-box protein [Cardamine amara subsp. amara]|uniref:F-box protein n=1 Tax=Cardamine amara subsp. amara TaxID=228776 RepID=A0ABD1A8X7_CARAN